MLGRRARQPLELMGITTKIKVTACSQGQKGKKKNWGSLNWEKLRSYIKDSRNRVLDFVKIMYL